MASPQMEPVTDEAESPKADLGIWMTPADSGVEEMAVPDEEPPNILITKIQFLLTKAPSNDSIPKMLQNLMKAAFPNGEAAIYPLVSNPDHPAITADQINKHSLGKYFDAWSHSKGLDVTMRVTLPVSLTKFKRTHKDLWKYLQDKSIFWHEDALAYAKEQSTPVFLYGVPTDGLNLKELALQLANQCNLEGIPFRLHVGNGAWKDAKSRVILVTCAKRDEKTVTHCLFDGLNRPIKDEAWRASPFPRVKPMTTRPIANHRLCKVTGIINALNDQAEIIKNCMKVSYTQLGGLDTVIKQPNGDAASLRKVFYTLSKEGKQTVFNIYRTGPGRVIFMINKHHIHDFTQKLERIFDSLQEQGYSSFETITGYQDRPRRPSDPTLFPEHIASYIADMNMNRSRVVPPASPMTNLTSRTAWPALVPKTSERIQQTSSASRKPAWQLPKLTQAQLDPIMEENTPDDEMKGSGDEMKESPPTPQAQSNWMPNILTDSNKWSDEKTQELQAANQRIARLEEELMTAKLKTAEIIKEVIDLHTAVSSINTKVDYLKQGIDNNFHDLELRISKQFGKIDEKFVLFQTTMEQFEDKMDDKFHQLQKRKDMEERKDAEDLNSIARQLVFSLGKSEGTPIRKSKPKKVREGPSPILQRGLSLFRFDSRAVPIATSEKETDSQADNSRLEVQDNSSFEVQDNSSLEVQNREGETPTGGQTGPPLSI